MCLWLREIGTYKNIRAVQYSIKDLFLFDKRFEIVWTGPIQICGTTI